MFRKTKQKLFRAKKSYFGPGAVLEIFDIFFRTHEETDKPQILTQNAYTSGKFYVEISSMYYRGKKFVYLPGNIS